MHHNTDELLDLFENIYFQTYLNTRVVNANCDKLNAEM